MSLTAEAFAWVRDLAFRESAIVLGPGKEYLVEARLGPLARAAGTVDVSAYVTRVRASGKRGEIDAVVEALTTNETSWFRDRAPFDVFRKVVVPELLRSAAHRPVRIWSAACSSGQEPYTLAMLMAEEAPGRRADILATDLSAAMVARTVAGQYSQTEVGRGLPASMLVKHFQRAGTQWQVSEQLRSMVQVRRLNLAAPWPALPRFDVVFLRNVLIYFDATTKRSILERLRQVLSPSGFLFLGAAETTLGIDETWHHTRVGRFTLYRPTAVPVHGPAADRADVILSSTGGG